MRQAPHVDRGRDLSPGASAVARSRSHRHDDDRLMAVHEAPVAETVEWYTPPELFDALGLRFDLDPAAPDILPAWIPADRHYSFAGQSRPWEGRVWLNPPYGASLPAFVDKMC